MTDAMHALTHESPPESFQILQAYLAERMKLTGDHVAHLKAVFVPKHLGKGEFLQRAGEVPRYGAFIARGCLRSYVIDGGGGEHILQFAPENWWLADLGSLATGRPTTLFFDALEDSELLLIDAPSHAHLTENIPGYAASFQTGVQRQSSAKDHRIISSLSASAEDRYREFLAAYPSIALRVPQHMLASYLGITPETLSRVRKRLATDRR
jgi:CRP/FNR family transcriptional regulator, anaerobic regulatory protein